MKWCIKIAASDVLSVASCVFYLSINGCKYMDFFVKIPKKRYKNNIICII